MTTANSSNTTGPISHPIWAMLHARDSTPDPITAVITCADAVHTLPVYHVFPAPIPSPMTKKSVPKPFAQPQIHLPIYMPISRVSITLTATQNTHPRNHLHTQRGKNKKADPTRIHYHYTTFTNTKFSTTEVATRGGGNCVGCLCAEVFRRRRVECRRRRRGEFGARPPNTTCWTPSCKWLQQQRQ